VHGPARAVKWEEGLLRTAGESGDYQGGWGRDDVPVKMNLESWGHWDLSGREGVREKLVWLMNRLSVMRGEDGRKATTVKVTVRVQGQASLLISSGRSLDSVDSEYFSHFRTIEYISGC
jgi:hypothetical protein